MHPVVASIIIAAKERILYGSTRSSCYSDGKTIELSRETYRQIRKLLGENDQTAPRSRRVAEIRATYDKYAGKPSLVKALLEEHRAELAREETRLKRHNG